MLAKYILFFVLGMRAVMSDVNEVTLNLASPEYDKLVTEYLEFDNVQYAVYKPAKGNDLVGVLDGTQRVWKSSGDRDRSKFVMMAFDKGVPALLYVYTGLNNYYDNFFAKTKDKWVKSNLSEFSLKLSNLKLGKLPQEFALNLDSTSSTEKFTLSPTTNFKKFDTFTPRRGFFATSVYYGVSLLWKAEFFGQKAVAAWAFKYDDTHYLLRLMVTNAFNNYRFYNFVRVKNVWVDAESGPFGFVKADDTKFPEDFYFPQYFLLSQNRSFFDYAKKLPLETKTMDPAVDFKPQSKREDYDFKYHNARIPYNSCHKLDFSKRFFGSVVMTKNGVLDKVLKVKTFYPKSGNFFGNVVDGQTVLYKRNLDSEACVGVHFYSKDNKYYLADLLVTSPHNPRSEYHVKNGDKWTSITKASFLELMEGLNA